MNVKQKQDFSIKIHGINITNPHKIYYPKANISKLDLINYYRKIFSKMKPFIIDRPISMVRSPHGITQENFYQKHPSESFPSFIERVKIKEAKGTTGVYITIDELDDILYLVNLGVLEFHVTLSKISDFEHPDQLVFDFDPDEATSFEYVIDGCLKVREILLAQGFKPKLKTSGGKGFHVYASIHKKLTWEESKAYAKSIALKLATDEPEKFTTELRKAKRVGKVFVDYLRNQRGATAICTYSTRAREGAPVSMPIKWAEIREVSPQYFKLRNFI